VVEEAVPDVIAAGHAKGMVEVWRHPSFIDEIAQLQRGCQVRTSYRPDDIQFHDRSVVQCARRF
jgi:predicted ATPase